MKPKIWSHWAFRLGFTALLLGLLAGKVDAGPIIQTLRSVQLVPFGLAVLLGFLVQWVTAAQMRLGMIPFGIEVSTWRLFEIGLISGFYSLVVPGGMVTGGAVTWAKIARDSGQTLAAGLLVIYFRAINTAVLVLFGTIAVFLDPTDTFPGLRMTFFLLSVASLFGLAILVLPPFGRFARRLLAWLAGSLPSTSSARALCRKFSRLFRLMYAIRARRYFGIVLYGCILNVGFVLVWIALALSIRMPVSPWVVGWISTIQGVLQLVPVTIGGLGVREGSLVYLLEPYGLAGEHAIAFSMTVFAAMCIGACAGGVLETVEILRRRKRRSA